MTRINRAAGLENPLQNVFPQPIVGQRAPGANDKNYPIGQMWINQPSNDSYILTSIVDGSPVWTITGNAEGGFPTTPFVVGPMGEAGYQTIQSALDAANAAGGGTVQLQPGTYNENLTLYSGVHITGPVRGDSNSYVINGSHTPPLSGNVTLNNILLRSATNIITSASAGTCEIIIDNCLFEVTNGYVFDLLNWTGRLRIFLCSDNSPENGVINNTGGAPVEIFNSQVGAGNLNTMIISGNFTANSVSISCFTDAQSSPLFVSTDTGYNATLTLSGSTAAFLCNSNFATGSDSAVAYNATGNCSLLACTINSANALAIAGTGTGTVLLSTTNFNASTGIDPSISIGGGVDISETFRSANLSSNVEISANDLIAGGSNSDVDINLNPQGTGSISSNGNLQLPVPATQLRVEGGAATDFIGQATLAAGSVQVSNTNIAATDRIFLTYNGTGLANTGDLSYTIIASSFFTIESTNAADTNVVSYFIVRQL